MPSRAMTINPEYNDEGQLMDFQVQHTHHGGQVDATIVEDAEGRQHYQYVEEQRDPEGVYFDKHEYAGLLFESTPGLKQMLEFANTENTGLPSGFTDEWNDLIDAEGDGFDLGRLHQMLGILQEAYENADHQEPVSETEAWFDSIPQEEVDQQVEYIRNTDVSFDQAEQLTALHSQTQSPAEDFIIRAGVDIAYGKASTEDKLQEAIKRFGAAEAYKGYMRLSSLL